MIKVKVCGITNTEDALKAVFYGAWAVGFVFYKKSPRYVSPSKAKKIIEALPPFISTVGVFVNQSERAVRDICRFTRINILQFHGDEKPVYCKRFTEHKILKAFRVNEHFDFDQLKKYKVDGYLFDAYQERLYGGTGKSFQWALLKGLKLDKPYILSGGLNKDNIKEALSLLNPYAVDISSGLEKRPGLKDPKFIREFFNSLKAKED